MNYIDVISKSLQKSLTDHLEVHRVNEHFILEITYDLIVDMLVDDLAKEGYTITKGSSSVG